MLTGELVRLRPVEMSDLDRYLQWVNDAAVTQFMAVSFPVSRDQEEGWIQAAAQKTRPPEIVLAIDVIEEERHIGSIALHDINSIDGQCSLGIMIGDSTRWNHGYGTDAIITLLRFGFDEINLHRVWLEVDAENARGIACYRKCGFVEEGRLREDRFHGGAYHDTLIMGVLAPEFRERHPTPV